MMRRFFALLLTAVLALSLLAGCTKSQEDAQLGEHRANIGEHVLVLLAGQLRDLTAGHGAHGTDGLNLHSDPSIALLNEA